MSRYWREFFHGHVKRAGEDPYRQVGRTLGGSPMGDEMLGEMMARWVELLDLRAQHVVLDFCCGNGLLSERLLPLSRRVIGVDFNLDLLARSGADHLRILADGNAVDFRAGSFDRIVFAAALQHFDASEVIDLLFRMRSWLAPDGRVLVTDVLDAQRIWSYYDSEEREHAYFEHARRRTPILGSWFDRRWLEKLARHAGYRRSRIVDQPADYWYSHYRFDLLLHR